MLVNGDQEGLPDYWGIETLVIRHIRGLPRRIRKDYPTTGVLRLFEALPGLQVKVRRIRKDYPTTGVLRLSSQISLSRTSTHSYQEGLPDYWGIETRLIRCDQRIFCPHQEGLPDYWGIETICKDDLEISIMIISGRITRLLGY